MYWWHPLRVAASIVVCMQGGMLDCRSAIVTLEVTWEVSSPKTDGYSLCRVTIRPGFPGHVLFFTLKIFVPGGVRGGISYFSKNVPVFGLFRHSVANKSALERKPTGNVRSRRKLLGWNEFGKSNKFSCCIRKKIRRCRISGRGCVYISYRETPQWSRGSRQHICFIQNNIS